MKKEELIAILQALPDGVDVEVNDNNGGEVYPIDQVDYFEANEDYAAGIMIQVNCN